MSFSDEKETMKIFGVKYMRYSRHFEGSRKDGYNFAFLYLNESININDEDKNRHSIRICQNESYVREARGQFNKLIC